MDHIISGSRELVVAYDNFRFGSCADVDGSMRTLKGFLFLVTAALECCLSRDWLLQVRPGSNGSLLVAMEK